MDILYKILLTLGLKKQPQIPNINNSNITPPHFKKPDKYKNINTFSY